MLIAAVLTLPAIYGFITGPAADGVRVRREAPAVPGASTLPTRRPDVLLAVGAGVSSPGGAVAVEGPTGLRGVDLGKVTAGEHLRMPDILRVKNRSDEPLAVRVGVSPGVAPSLRVPKGVRNRLLEPGEELQVSVDVVPLRDAPPGAYDGALTIDQGVDGNLYTVPVHIQIVPGPHDVLPGQ